MYAAPAPVVEHIAPALAASYGVPAPTAFAAPAPVVEHISPDLTVYVAPSPVVEYISPDLAEYAAAEYITPAPMLCRDDLEKLCYVARMSRKRIWRCVWHGRSTPSDAPKSERSWRKLPKCLCYEEVFDEMKRACATVACLRT